MDLNLKMKILLFIYKVVFRTVSQCSGLLSNGGKALPDAGSI